MSTANTTRQAGNSVAGAPAAGSVRTVALVGHCGPDSSFLRMAIGKALPGARVLAADSDEELKQLAADGGSPLLLVNRQLDYGFKEQVGVELIRRLRLEQPGVKAMLISNYPDAQREAEAAGALPGFGKRDIGGAKVTQMLRDAVGADAKK